jgi:hypothetical protein
VEGGKIEDEDVVVDRWVWRESRICGLGTRGKWKEVSVDGLSGGILQVSDTTLDWLHISQGIDPSNRNDVTASPIDQARLILVGSTGSASLTVRVGGNLASSWAQKALSIAGTAVIDRLCGALGGLGGGCLSKPACVGVVAFGPPSRASAKTGSVAPPSSSGLRLAFADTRIFSGRPPVRVLARVRVRGFRVRLAPLALLLALVLLPMLALELERRGGCIISPWAEGESGDGGPPTGRAIARMTRERGSSSVEYAFLQLVCESGCEQRTAAQSFGSAPSSSVLDP